MSIDNWFLTLFDIDLQFLFSYSYIPKNSLALILEKKWDRTIKNQNALFWLFQYYLWLLLSMHSWWLLFLYVRRNFLQEEFEPWCHIVAIRPHKDHKAFFLSNLNPFWGHTILPTHMKKKYTNKYFSTLLPPLFCHFVEGFQLR